MSTDQLTFDEAILAMPEQWRYRWCASGPCACMGGANCSGGLSRQGFTFEQWQEWVSNNPNPNPPKKYDPEELRRALEPLFEREQASTPA